MKQLSIILAAAILICGLGTLAHAQLAEQPGRAPNLYLKLAAAPTVAPGAGVCNVFWVAGTTGGSGKEQAICGTSTTPVTIIDNVGAGF